MKLNKHDKVDKLKYNLNKQLWELLSLKYKVPFGGKVIDSHPENFILSSDKFIDYEKYYVFKNRVSNRENYDKLLSLLNYLRITYKSKDNITYSTYRYVSDKTDNIYLGYLNEYQMDYYSEFSNYFTLKENGYYPNNKFIKLLKFKIDKVIKYKYLFTDTYKQLLSELNFVNKQLNNLVYYNHKKSPWNQETKRKYSSRFTIKLKLKHKLRCQYYDLYDEHYQV